MKNKSEIKYICIWMFGILLFASCNHLNIYKVSDTIVTKHALVLGDPNYGETSYGKNINGQSFQQDVLTTFNNYQYVGYYDGERRVCIGRRKLPDGKWEIITFKDHLITVNNAHNTISLGICRNDGTIHIAFDHHAGQLHYRVSKKAVATNPEKVNWSTSLFSAPSDELEKGKPIKSVTYPRFIQTPEGSIQFCYRTGGSGDGSRILIDYNPLTAQFENARRIDSGEGIFKDFLGESNSRNSYPNGYTYGPKGKLHTTWVWRESTQGANHDLMYAYSNDGGNTWVNNLGESLKDIITINSPGIKVVNIGREYALMNTHGQAVDSKGQIHTVVWHASEETLNSAGVKSLETPWAAPSARRYHHYWRDEVGEWHHTELPMIAGNRSKLLLDKKDNAYIIFGQKQSSSEWDGPIYFDKGDLVIMGATAQSNWNDWKVIHIEEGPFINEMLADFHRWKKSGILSVIVQESSQGYTPSPLRILDFKLRKTFK